MAEPVSLTKRRRMFELGQRAVDYYVDTGLCVFCDADDLVGIPHEDCDVGIAAEVVVDAARIDAKSRERAAVDEIIESAFRRR